MTKILYGARTHEDYYDDFVKNYADIGNRIFDQVDTDLQKRKNISIIKKLMSSGIEKAKNLAESQSLGMGVDNFTKNYNELSKNFEKVTYNFLEHQVNFFAKNLTEDLNFDNLDFSQSISSFKNKQNKNKKKLEDSVGDEMSRFLSSATNLLSKDENTKNNFKDLLNSYYDINTKEIKKSSGYYGKIGEYTQALMLNAVSNMKGEVFNALAKELRKNKNAAIVVGGQLEKTDLQYSDLFSISIKNYGLIRNNFTKSQEVYRTNKNKEKEKFNFVDVSINDSGFLETVINDLMNREKSLLKINEQDEFLTYIMNSMYFSRYGVKDYANKANELLKRIISSFAYVYFIEGVNLNANALKTKIPGYIYFTGKGLIPTYKILEQISFEYMNYMKKNLKQTTETSLKLSISGYKSGIESVDYTGKTNSYNENNLKYNGLYYHKSRAGLNQDRETVLKERYDSFSKQIKAKVKMQLYFSELNKIIENYYIAQ